jgi:hypothetical protein
MDRQPLYDLREDYASGNHPVPNGDRRYARALRELHAKANTNYISLIQSVITQKIRHKDFRFGDGGGADKDAERIWQANDMDFQSPVIIQKSAELGFSFAIVEPPTEENPLPQIYFRNPRNCEIERDPQRITKTLAGLEYWVDEPNDIALAILYLPDAIYYFEGRSNKPGFLSGLTSGQMSHSMNDFEIVSVVENVLGEVPLQRCDWIPAAGERGLAAGEKVWNIQDRMNKTMLDRLVISNSQAYRQRWVSGAPKPKAGQHKPPWEPGADVLWLSTDPNTKFGDFQETDIKNLLEAIRDDVGDMAALEQIPAVFLVNRLVNVGGDTVLQANAGHTAKVKLHQDAIGFFFERLMKLAFKYIGDARATEVVATATWWPVEVRSHAEVADAFQKLIASGLPMQLAMEFTGAFTDDQIQFAVAEAERVKQEAIAREDEVAEREAQRPVSQPSQSGE